MGVKINGDGIFKGLLELEEKTKVATQIYANSAGLKMVGYAKSNASWTDRTGQSRQTINHEVTNAGNKVTIAIKGNSPQFKYLEFCHEKRFAILAPTIQENSNSVVGGWVKILGGK